jgi:hypothetical protein
MRPAKTRGPRYGLAVADGSSSPGAGTRAEQALAAQVHVAGGYRPFGELTREEVAARGDELADVGGWGPLQRVVPVARAWRALAREMEELGVATVGELDAASVVAAAERLWVLPPAEGMI